MRTHPEGARPATACVREKFRTGGAGAASGSRFAVVVVAAAATVPATLHAQSVKQECARAAESGQRLLKAGKLTAGRAEFLTCARDVCPGAVRPYCLRWLEEVDAALPSFVVRARDAEGND